MITFLKKFRKNYFYLRVAQSPTYFNLAKFLRARGWRSARFNWRADFGERNFQFNQQVAEQLEFKHLLAQLVSQYCPQIMPVTYCINDQNWATILQQVSDKYYARDHQLQDQVDGLLWILKPALLNNGQNIKIFQKLSQLEQHYLSSDRLGGEHVLQQYVDQPHLLKGHKYSIRMFVVLTTDAGAYLYPHGYFNVAQSPYQPNDFTNLNPHLTNEHLHEDAANVIQIPTQRFDFFPELFEKITKIVTEVASALQQMYPQFLHSRAGGNPSNPLAIFGFDFLVDANKHVWLLEANHGPCFPVDPNHPLQKYLYDEFWQAFIDSFVLPIAERKFIFVG